MADYVTKHHSIWYHRTTRQRYLTATKKDIENPKERQTGIIIGCDGTTNPWVTRKTDNPLRGIRNPITRNPDNPLKGIRNLVPNIIRIHWQRGLTVPTYIEKNSYNQPLIAT